MKAKKKGSGLAAVMIFSAILGFGIYSVLSLVEGEFRRSKKSALYHEARLAAEALLQNSMADLRQRYQSSLADDALSPSNQPLRVTDEFVSRYESAVPESNLVIPASRTYTAWDEYGNEMEVLGGKVKNLSNSGDFVYIDPRVPGNENDRLKGTMVLVRSVEMLSKATTSRPVAGGATVHARQFLQVRDAPLFAYAIFYNLPMEIAPGPKMEVHGKIHANKDAWFQSNDRLDIYSTVTIAGDLHHGRHADSGQSDSDGVVTVKDGEDNLVNMKEDSSWPDEVRDAFPGGWLESSDVGFAGFATRLWDGNLQTAAHGVESMDLPGVSQYTEDTDPNTPEKESFNSAYTLIQPPLDKDDVTAERETREKQKFSYKAGLNIKVDGSGHLSYFTYERDAKGNLKYDADGKPKTISLNPVNPVASTEIFLDDGKGTVLQGMHDKRQARDLNIVEVDVNELKDLLHGDGSNSSDWGGEAPKNWWNGVVYVDFPQESASSSRPDDVNPAEKGWGVKLVNGSVIPSPSYAADKGTTFATNQMLYVQGDYNADGNRNTGTPTTPDDPGNFGKEGYEAPAALVADSVTFLSNSWDDSNSLQSMKKRKASDTEVSAAVLTGLVPSGEEGTDRYSGGVENFPRFLENWSGKKLRIRGSMVALFESEVGTRGWGYGDVYSAPNRDWGFQLEFAKGKLPPGTPLLRDFKAVDFEIINASDYASHFQRIKTDDFGG